MARGLVISLSQLDDSSSRPSGDDNGLSGGNLVLRKWVCDICGMVYDEAEGWPDDDIAPGTRFEDIPDDWECPDCGACKDSFSLLEE